MENYAIVNHSTTTEAGEKRHRSWINGILDIFDVGLNKFKCNF